MAELFVFGLQLELKPGAVDAAAMDALVAAMEPLDADWGGHAPGGRVEVMATMSATDARDAVAQGMAALRRSLGAAGLAFETHRLRAVGAQPVDNPADWVNAG